MKITKSELKKIIKEVLEEGTYYDVDSRLKNIVFSDVKKDFRKIFNTADREILKDFVDNIIDKMPEKLEWKLINYFSDMIPTNIVGKTEESLKWLQKYLRNYKKYMD